MCDSSSSEKLYRVSSRLSNSRICFKNLKGAYCQMPWTWKHIIHPIKVDHRGYVERACLCALNHIISITIKIKHESKKKIVELSIEWQEPLAHVILLDRSMSRLFQARLTVSTERSGIQARLFFWRYNEPREAKERWERFDLNEIKKMEK